MWIFPWFVKSFVWKNIFITNMTFEWFFTLRIHDLLTNVSFDLWESFHDLSNLLFERIFSSQTWHLNGFSPYEFMICLLMSVLSFDLCESFHYLSNLLYERIFSSQTWHLNGFSSWEFMICLLLSVLTYVNLSMICHISCRLKEHFHHKYDICMFFHQFSCFCCKIYKQKALKFIQISFLWISNS